MGKKKLKEKETQNYVMSITGIIVFLISFFTYLKTLTPSIPLHDAGELVTCAWLLGIPHPPGYPFYCLLGKLWITILPIGNIAYRMNMLSALCGALTCMMVYFIILKVGSGKLSDSNLQIQNPKSKIQNFIFLIPAMIAGLTLAFATTFWEQAVIAEKYTLNALFATLLIFILLKWAEVISTEHGARSTEQKTPYFLLHAPRSMLHAPCFLYLFAFTLGLSFTHHFQTIFLLPATIFLVIAVVWWKKGKDGKTYSISLSPLSPFFPLTLFFILPFSFYLYLPLRAIFHPAINMGDPKTLERFLEHIQTAQFSGYFETSIADFFYRLYTYTTQFFPNQFTIYLVLPGLIGMFSLFKHSPKLWTFLSLILLTNILHSLFYNIPNIQDHYLPAFIVFTVWIGYGVQSLIQWWGKYSLLPTNPKSKIQNPKFSTSYSKLSTLYFLLFLLLPIIPLITHYQHSDRSQDYFATDLVRNILNPMEDKAIIFLETDDTAFPLWYIHYVEKAMPTAILIDVPFLAVHYDWYARNLQEKYPDLAFDFKFQDMLGIKSKELEEIRQERIINIISKNIDSHPIYNLYNPSLANSYSLIPQGIFSRVLSKDTEELCQILDKNKGFLYRGVMNKEIFKDKRTQDLISRYPQTYYNIGTFYFQTEQYDKAIKEFKQALELDPKYLNARYGIGMCYKYKGLYSNAMAEFKRILAIEPNFDKAYYGINCVEQEQGKTGNR
ncbi:MAG: DUF2723 domain-containing protein [bacterium]|nr:DUF2723 domain-containing protein [bacterium]